MLIVSCGPLFTPRLELRRTRVEDAAAIFTALRDPLMYLYVPRSAPIDAAEVAQRFARVMLETAPDRLDQWLNWTVWLRDGGAGLGTIEATVKPDQRVEIGYLFDPRVWRRGFAREAVGAMITHLSQNGAAAFEAVIDIRNDASKALVSSLGFLLHETRGIDEIWRRS